MLSYELREQIISYLHDEVTLAAMEEWFVPRLSIFLENPASDDADLIATIELALAELADGLIDENEVRASLQESLSRIGHTVTAPNVSNGYRSTIITGSRSRVQNRPFSSTQSVISLTSR